jgi:hypothetical protein
MSVPAGLKPAGALEAPTSARRPEPASADGVWDQDG